jgi:hypothetical protein
MFPYHECSLPTFSLPTFPFYFPCQKQSLALVLRKLLHTEVLRYFPSHFSLPTFSYTFSLFRLFPCPLFPTLVPCQKQSVAPDSPESPPLLSLCVFFPSFSLPTVPCPLSLFSIVSLPSFPIFDYFPSHLSSLMILCCLYKLLQ